MLTLRSVAWQTPPSTSWSFNDGIQTVMAEEAEGLPFLAQKMMPCNRLSLGAFRLS